MDYVFAIDPGTGSSSPAAVALYNAKKEEVIWSADIWPLGYKSRGNKIPPHQRIKMIVEQIEKLWQDTIKKYPINKIGVVTENFVMHGKGGATLQQMRGAVLCLFPLTQSVVEVQNTSMKKIAGGKGSADKEQIAENLIKIIPNSAKYLTELKELKAWDQIDAIGIAYSARFD